VDCAEPLIPGWKYQETHVTLIRWFPAGLPGWFQPIFTGWIPGYTQYHLMQDTGGTGDMRILIVGRIKYVVLARID
jgi:hypothetical protein